MVIATNNIKETFSYCPRNGKNNTKIRIADEIWVYDEPHQSGGNCRITMTKRQAIEWMKKIYDYRKYQEQFKGIDEQAFIEWVAVHWAHKEADPKAK